MASSTRCQTCKHYRPFFDVSEQLRYGRCVNPQLIFLQCVIPYKSPKVIFCNLVRARYNNKFPNPIYNSCGELGLLYEKASAWEMIKVRLRAVFGLKNHNYVNGLIYLQGPLLTVQNFTAFTSPWLLILQILLFLTLAFLLSERTNKMARNWDKEAFKGY